jgi:hypothetical protein
LSAQLLHATDPDAPNALLMELDSENHRLTVEFDDALDRDTAHAVDPDRLTVSAIADRRQHNGLQIHA